MSGSVSGKPTLEPLYTSNHLEAGSKSTPPSSAKPRTRSVSPHARAILRRTFSRSRSRSRSSRASSHKLEDDDVSVSSSVSSSSASSRSSSRSNRSGKQMLVAVTSCRSDAYYAQKAPGAVSMLPRKAPSALKTFHELAVGVKDADEAVGGIPVKVDTNSEEFQRLPRQEQEGRTVLWDFMKNINFVSFAHVFMTTATYCFCFVLFLTLCFTAVEISG